MIGQPLTGSVGFRSGLSLALGFILPMRCAACGTTTGGDGAFCAACWREIRFIAAPQCEQCGYPFELDFGEGVKCGACLSSRPHYDRARSALAYDDRIAKVLIAFKHGDRTDLAPVLSALMRRVGAELLSDADLIVPVPLHRNRLFQRRFNQSVLLARPLSRDCGVPLAAELLRRKRRTASQGHLSPTARRRNVEGAFQTGAADRQKVKGKRVLIVDDVLTTGATVNAIARRLKRDGAVGVDVLTLARVVRETAPS